MATNQFIEQQTKLYKSLKPCYCSAIENTVYFNAEGLRHLLYKDNRPRNINEKIYRMHLVDYLVDVITQATSAQKQLINESSFLWILEWITITDKKGNDLKIKIILRKKGNGNTHFLSAMQKNNCYKSKKTRKK